ncbi:hypothetical protein [Streptomyces sp. NBC_01727]|uniref:hypothetical protein n=1 Tax=unclassified Streptomyces TaxID=2593676 RepID=UPI002E12CD93|nr:hypothetical protein OIE76_30870 [Streptomyces sp. NBC_01727]
MAKLCEAHDLAFRSGSRRPTAALTGGAAEALAGIAERHGATRGQIALAWLPHRSPVPCPTPDTGSPVHPAEDLGAAEIRLSTQT